MQGTVAGKGHSLIHSRSVRVRFQSELYSVITKGPDLCAGADVTTGEVVQVFSPRVDAGPWILSLLQICACEDLDVTTVRNARPLTGTSALRGDVWRIV